MIPSVLSYVGAFFLAVYVSDFILFNSLNDFYFYVSVFFVTIAFVSTQFFKDK